MTGMLRVILHGSDAVPLLLPDGVPVLIGPVAGADIGSPPHLPPRDPEDPEPGTVMRAQADDTSPFTSYVVTSYVVDLRIREIVEALEYGDVLVHIPPSAAEPSS